MEKFNMENHQNSSMALRFLLTKMKKEVSLTARYSCMKPIIAENATVRISPISEPLKRGDILLIDQGYRFVIHRLLKVDRYTTFYTSGDNGFIFDTRDCQYTVLGVVTSVKTGENWFEVRKPAFLQYFLAVIGYACIRRSSHSNQETQKWPDFKQILLWKFRKGLTIFAKGIYVLFTCVNYSQKNKQSVSDNCE
jgi:hypothetical protein